MAVHVRTHEFPVGRLQAAIDKEARGLAVHLQHHHVILAIVDPLAAFNVTEPPHVVDHLPITQEKHLAVLHPLPCSRSLGHQWTIPPGIELHHHGEIAVKAEGSFRIGSIGHHRCTGNLSRRGRILQVLTLVNQLALVPDPHPRRLSDGMLVGHFHPPLSTRRQVHHMISKDNQLGPGGPGGIVIEKHPEVRVVLPRLKRAGTCRLRKESLQGLFQRKGGRRAGNLGPKGSGQRKGRKEDRKEGRLGTVHN